jgi:hypothetical protein
MKLFCVNFYKQLAILLNLEILMSRVTGNLIWECPHSIFHFRLWTWAAAALAWAMGEHSWARLEHTISKPEHVLKIHFSIRRSSFGSLRPGYTYLVLSLKAGPIFSSDKDPFGTFFKIYIRGSRVAFVRYLIKDDYRKVPWRWWKLLLPYTWSLKIKVKKSTSLRDLIACGHAKRLPLSIAHSSQPLQKKNQKNLINNNLIT